VALRRRDQNRGGAPKGERVPLNARPRPKRRRMATSAAWRGPTRQSRLFGAPPPLILFGGKSLVALVGKTRARVRRENESARFTLPWRGRVAHRRCAGWGARRRRDSQRAARAFTPSRRASRVDLPPPGEGGGGAGLGVLPSLQNSNADEIDSRGAWNDSSSSTSALDLALSRLRCRPRPFHRATRGPPSPLSRGRMQLGSPPPLSRGRIRLRR
jgi:hypothetical protein